MKPKFFFLIFAEEQGGGRKLLVNLLYSLIILAKLFELSI